MTVPFLQHPLSSLPGHWRRQLGAGLHVGARSWLIHRTIAKLEEDLDPALFLRVHRSVILRKDTIAGLYRDEAGHWTARLKDGGEQRIGRSYIDNVKRLAGR